MGCERFWVKDERSRMSLGSFKALGGAYAVYCSGHPIAEERVEDALAVDPP